MFGIDISTWQGDYDLSRAQLNGVEAVVIKCGGADDGLYEDSQFRRNVQKAEFLGIPYGLYYFGSWNQHINNQIAHCLNLITGTNPVLGVYYDIEGGLLQRSPNEVTNMANYWIDAFRQYGYEPGVYASSSVFDSHLGGLGKCRRWVAQWSTDKPSGQVDIWQFGGETNYLRDPVFCGQVTDQDYFYIKLPEKRDRYNKESELPKWAQPVITALINKGVISGSGKKDQYGRPIDLDLSMDMIRMLVMTYRMTNKGE